MVFIYAVGLAGTALQAFNTVRRLHIADAVKLGDKKRVTSINFHTITVHNDTSHRKYSNYTVIPPVCLAYWGDCYEAQPA